MNTPEQEAKDLVDQYMEYTPAEEKFELPYAKKCALIDCQNTIKELDHLWLIFEKHIIFGSQNAILGRMAHYRKLKQAIKAIET